MNNFKDPTRTLVLRNRASREVNRRFSKVKADIRSAFKVGNLITNRTASPGEFTFTRDVNKIPEFERFLQQSIDQEILRTNQLSPTQRGRESHWLNVHIGEGYRRGATKARLAAERSLPNLQKLPDYNPFTNAAHIARSELIYQRVYSDLQGVTQAMSKQISSILAQGIIKGQNSGEVAKLILDRVDKIGITRAKLIARTEIIESHNLANIKEAELLEKETNTKIKVMWLTALDGRQRHTHDLRHENIYTREEAEQLLGEPNCRCAVAPHFDDEDDLINNSRAVVVKVD